MDPDGNIMDPAEYLNWPPPGHVNWLENGSFLWENAWPRGEVPDQGPEPTSVGFAFASWHSRWGREDDGTARLRPPQ